MRRRLPDLVLAPLLVAASAAAQQPPTHDRVLLKSGRELIGTLREDDGGRHVQFEDVELGPLRVDTTRVRAIVRAGSEPSLFAPAAPAEPGTAPERYVRFQPGAESRPGSLQTAVTRWRHPQSGSTVFLVGATHIGDGSYFARLQRILDACDLVLFEGVGRGKDGRAPSEDELARMDALTQLQVKLKDVLGLQFQHDGIDYRRSFWRNADVDFTTLTERMQQEGISLPTDNPLVQMLLKLALGALDPERAKRDPRLGRQLRRQVAPVLAMADEILARREMKGLRKVLIEERNAVAIEHLQAALGEGSRWIAVFYGAGHLLDLQQRLRAEGFTFEGCAWVDAWRVD